MSNRIPFHTFLASTQPHPHHEIDLDLQRPDAEIRDYHAAVGHVTATLHRHTYDSVILNLSGYKTMMAWLVSSAITHEDRDAHFTFGQAVRSTMGYNEHLYVRVVNSTDLEITTPRGGQGETFHFTTIHALKMALVLLGYKLVQAKHPVDTEFLTVALSR